MKRKLIWLIFWAMVGIFGLAIGVTFIPVPTVTITAGGVAALLGAVLLFLTVSTKVKGLLRIFLLLSGASAVGLPIFILLHNLVSLLLDTEEPVFFFMAILVCPIGLLVGVVGTIVLAIKNRQVKQSSQNSH